MLRDFNGGALGTAQRALDVSVEYAKQRRAFGREIGGFQAVAFRLAQIAAEVESARVTTYWASSLWDEGKAGPKEVAVAKLVATETAVTAGPPTDYTQVEGLSEPVHDTVFEVVRLPMRDGVEIYIEITRPDIDEPVPVILEASPYHGTIATRIGDRIFPDPKDEQGRNLGLVGYFAPRGYAVAMMGLRGPAGARAAWTTWARTTGSTSRRRSSGSPTRTGPTGGSA